MGVLEMFCYTLFVFAPLAPPLAHRKYVDASDNDGCSGIAFLMFKSMNDKENIKSCKNIIGMKNISPVIQFKRQE